jgi:hypothetical protein
MNKFVGYICSLCKTEYAPDEVTYTCPKDGGNLDVVLDYEAIKNKYEPDDILSRSGSSLWSFLPLLPVQDPPGEATPLHAAGGTPVFNLVRLAESLNLKSLWLKDESRNPSASFKDRASAVVTVRAREIEAEVVVTASTGNAGAALACMAAAVGQKAVIFAPKSAPPAKVAQLLIFGAKVILVDGTYDDAFDLTIKASEEFGWYCRNTGYNPFTAEGKKTAAFEIWEWWQGMGTSFLAFTRASKTSINSAGCHASRVSSVYRQKGLPPFRTLSTGTRRRSHPSQQRRSPTRSLWTCRATAYGRYAPRRKQAERTLMYQMQRSSVPLQNWAVWVFLRNRPGQRRMPVWSRQPLPAWCRAKIPSWF